MDLLVVSLSRIDILAHEMMILDILNSGMAIVLLLGRVHSEVLILSNKLSHDLTLVRYSLFQGVACARNVGVVEIGSGDVARFIFPKVIRSLLFPVL